MNTKVTNPDEGWTLTRNVSLPTVLTILVQTVALAVYIGAMNSRVEVNTRDIERLSTAAERLAKVETKLEGVQVSLDRIERALSPRDHRPSGP